MEHINIIAQEAITVAIEWPTHLIATLGIIGIVGSFIYALMGQDMYKGTKMMYWFGFGSLALILITVAVTNLFFRVPTGRYKYEATIDKDNITVAEYEQFIEEYNPIIKDGIYYWEDKVG